MALCPGLPGWAGTRKVKPILDFAVARDSEWQWHQPGDTNDKSAPCSRQITTPAPHHSVFYRPDALPAAQPTASMHWRQNTTITEIKTTSWRQVDQAQILVRTHACTDTHTKEHTDWKTGKKHNVSLAHGMGGKRTKTLSILTNAVVGWDLAALSTEIWLHHAITGLIYTQNYTQ